MTELDRFKLILKEVGADWTAVIKVLGETTTLSIEEAVDLLERLPAIVKEGESQESAEYIQERLVEAGATAVVEQLRLAGVDYV